jgi:nucleotide-binding universal stress UspA family protein
LTAENVTSSAVSSLKELSVNRAATGGFRRILLAVDGSAGSLQASRLAFRLAASWGAALRAIAVVGKDRAGPLVARVETAPSARDRARASLEDTLAHLVRAGAEAGVTVEPALRVAPEVEPYEVILDEAERWPADLIVVGRGAHHGIGRALLGSQADHVLEFATLPIIVVPAVL